MIVWFVFFFLVLFLGLAVIACAIARWISWWTVRENAKPIEVEEYIPPQASKTVLEGFQDVENAYRQILADRSVIRQAEDVLEAYQKKGDAA